MTPVWNFAKSDYWINVTKFAHFKFGLVGILLGTINLLPGVRWRLLIGLWMSFIVWNCQEVEWVSWYFLLTRFGRPFESHDWCLLTEGKSAKSLIYMVSFWSQRGRTVRAANLQYWGPWPSPVLTGQLYYFTVFLSSNTRQSCKLNKPGSLLPTSWEYWNKVVAVVVVACKYFPGIISIPN